VARRAEIHHRPTKPPSGGWRPIRPRKPDWFDEYGSRVWDRIVTELEPLGILNPAQRELLAAYCEVASVNFAAWKELTPSKERGPDVLVAGRDQRPGVMVGGVQSKLRFLATFRSGDEEWTLHGECGIFMGTEGLLEGPLGLVNQNEGRLFRLSPSVSAPIQESCGKLTAILF